MGTIVSVALTWLIAKKQGIFNRTDVRASLYDLMESSKARPELVIGGPHSENNILTPVLVKIKNYGAATAHNIVVVIESDSSTIVNHPGFFISPVATDATEAIEGNVIYLGKDVFRRVFKVTELNPGKSVQLNNAGLPHNLVSEGLPLASSVLSVTIYEQGKNVKKSEFGVWLLDTTRNNFYSVLSMMAKKAKTDFKSRHVFRRFLARLLHHRHQHPLRLMEITELREVSIPGESRAFTTVNKSNVSYGTRLVTGYLFVGPIGFI